MEDSKKAERRYNIIITLLIFALIVMIVVLIHYKLTKTDASESPTATPPSSETKPAPPAKTTTVPTRTPPARPTPPTVDYYNVKLPALVKPSILIEKSKLRLTVFDSTGKIVKQYRAAVGANSGDKTREGDYRTPEGSFYVCVKNPQSKYVLSLGLSYPDISDAKRGYRDGQISETQYNRIVYAIRKGRQPPWNTPLGGEIMIHGKRNGGRDTEGCIALENDDIRELYPKISIGTKVVIKP